MRLPRPSSNSTSLEQHANRTQHRRAHLCRHALPGRQRRTCMSTGRPPAGAIPSWARSSPRWWTKRRPAAQARSSRPPTSEQSSASSPPTRCGRTCARPAKSGPRWTTACSSTPGRRSSGSGCAARCRARSSARSCSKAGRTTRPARAHAGRERRGAVRALPPLRRGRPDGRAGLAFDAHVRGAQRRGGQPGLFVAQRGDGQGAALRRVRARSAGAPALDVRRARPDSADGHSRPGRRCSSSR